MMDHAMLHRREFLRVGALGCLGLTLPNRLASARGHGQARAKNCIIIFLLGGPPQHETWDPKPSAPVGIRGDLQPIATNVPGIHVGELMPRVARHLDKICVLRGVTTGSNAHSGSGYEMLTGYPHLNKQTDNLAISDRDWPCMGAVVKYLSHGNVAQRLPGGRPVPSSLSRQAAVSLPQRIFNNNYVYWPGQNGGFLGRSCDPWLLECEPQADDFRIRELTLSDDVPVLRVTGRRSLLEQFDAQSRLAQQGPAVARYGQYGAQALDLLSSPQARQAFDLRQEPLRIRERYGRHKFNQSCLLARRLIEAGVRLVQVNWPREPNEISVGNPAWDTHSQNTERLRTALMPPMDQAYSVLLEDLFDRGLLEETLVVWMGEFGRTPRINANGGRDHWGNVFSVALAGGGIRGGQVFGASDAIGGEPRDGRVEPKDLTATIFSLLGHPPETEILDAQNRPHPISRGQVLTILGA